MGAAAIQWQNHLVRTQNRLHGWWRALAGRLVRQSLLFIAALVFATTLPVAAQALENGQTLDLGFPRTGLTWPDIWNQPLSDIARYDYVLLTAAERSAIPSLRASNPDIVLFTSTNAQELPLDTSAPGDSGRNAEIDAVPNEWILTQLGSTLSSSVGASDTIFHVGIPGANTAARFQAGDILVLGDNNELCKVRAFNKATGSISVVRGCLPERSGATPHSRGVRIAPAVVFWPGFVVMNLSGYCPKAIVDPAVGLETWGQYNARVALKLLNDADWDGLFVDRADKSMSFVIGPLRPSARSIDAGRTNIAVTDGYAASNASYRAALLDYESRVRAGAPDRLFVVNNGAPNYGLLDGGVLENAPSSAWSPSYWLRRVLPSSGGVETSYADWAMRSLKPNFSTLLAYEDESSPVDGAIYVNPFGTPGWHPNYQKMRFGLASSLMNDGFFDYEMNTNGHASGGLMWFDEYDNVGRGTGYLGRPATTARLGAPPLTSSDLLSSDGSFSTTARMNRWRLSSATGYSVSKALSGGTARIAVTRSRGALTGASIAHQNLPISKNAVYTLSFRARASRPLDIIVGGRRVTSPYTNYLPFGKASLGTTWGNYTFVTTSKGSASAAGLYFFLGQKTGTIWLDDVKVQKGWRPNVYRRDFQNGIALVNPELEPVTIPLGATYRRLLGTQAPSINNGKYISSVTLGAQDGLILLRTPVLTIPSDRTVSFGSMTTVSGSLKSVSGVALSDRRIVLRSSLDGRTWTAAAETTTSASGTYLFSVQPTRNTYYTTRFYGDGDAQNLESFSRTMAVNVRASIGDPTAPATMSRTRYYSVRGTLDPHHTAGTHPVRIYKYHYISGIWKSYGYTTATASDFLTVFTRYSASVRLPYAGAWRLRAYHPADTAHAATWSSGYDRVTVR